MSSSNSTIPRDGERTLMALLRKFEPFSNDPMVTEIVVNRPREIGVERAGTWSWHERPDLTFEVLEAIAILAAYLANKDVDPTRPLCSCVLPNDMRLFIARPPATLDGRISLTMRKPAVVDRSVHDPDFEGLFSEANAPRTQKAQIDDELVRLRRAGDWRKLVLLARRHRKTIGIAGRTGSGKAQPYDAKVLTPVGFRNIGDLRVGDPITTPSGTVAAVSGVFPQGDKQIFCVTFSDGRTVECCDDHLWKVWEWRAIYETGKTHATRKVVDGGAQWVIAPLSEIRNGEKGGHRWKRAAVPLVDPCQIEFPPQNLPIAPYALGALLGDGCFKHNKTTISSADADILDRIKMEMPAYEAVFEGGYDYGLRMVNRRDHIPPSPRLVCRQATATLPRGKARGTQPILLAYEGKTQTIVAWAAETGLTRKLIYERISVWGWSTGEALGLVPRPARSVMYSPLTVALKSLDLAGLRSHEKFVPEIYKRGSVSQRLALLQGLMDTDGSVGNGTNATFTSTSKQLALDVQEIAWSLGAIASIHPRQTYYTHKGQRRAGKPSWRASIVMQDVSVLFSLPRKVATCTKKGMRHRLKIVSTEPVGIKPAVCISIDHPDELYVTDNYVITHNTDIAKRLMRITDPDIRLITIESDPETARSGPRNTVNLLFGDSRSGITPEQCVDASLRMRPDEIHLGEIRGAEGFAYLRALAAGHPGGITTWHADEGEEITALKALVKQHEAGRALDDVEKRIKTFIDVIFWCDRSPVTKKFSVPRVWLKAEEGAPA